MKPHGITIDWLGGLEPPLEIAHAACSNRNRDDLDFSGLHFPRGFIRALGLIKKHAAKSNEAMGLISEKVAHAIQLAAQDVVSGALDDCFLVDIFQTGAAASVNANANDVIARRATEFLRANGSALRVDADHDVDRGQTSMDVVRTALHVAALEAIEYRLRPSLDDLHLVLQEKAREFARGRTRPRRRSQDTNSIGLADAFTRHAAQVDHGLSRLQDIRRHLGEVALGGTILGAGMRAGAEFGCHTIAGIAAETGLQLAEPSAEMEAQTYQDTAVETSGALKAVAVGLVRIASDVRWMFPAPRGESAADEIPPAEDCDLPLMDQANPGPCEMIVLVGGQIAGNDTTVAFAGMSGSREMSSILPIIVHNLLQSIELLAGASGVFARQCVALLHADFTGIGPERESRQDLIRNAGLLQGHNGHNGGEGPETSAEYTGGLRASAAAAPDNEEEPAASTAADNGPDLESAVRTSAGKTRSDF